MEAWNQDEKRILEKMDELRYPESVKTTAVWATRKAQDSVAAIEEVEALLDKRVIPKEVVRAVQKYLIP